ncbi:MAG: hypothetical protein ACP5QA_14135 [Phycisphaerae bacterium]
MVIEIGFASAALVLLALYVVASLGTCSGTVSVTANMPPFSPAIVKVGTAASTTLTATIGSDYNPPVPSPDEGSLTKSYSWSLTVLYSSAAAGSFTDAGAPGPTNYIYSPTPLPSQSPVQLTFTPERAGYWHVSASCSVTVTDTKTNQCWSGSAHTAPPRPLTSYTLDITYTGPVVGGGSDSGTVVTNKTTAVHAGWPIELGVTNVEPADLSKTFTWSIDGAGGNGSAAIGGYNPTTGPTYVTSLDPGSSTGATFPGAKEYYYYTTSGSETASVTPTGSGIPPAKTTFSVAKATAALSTTTSVVCGGTYNGNVGAISFGDGLITAPDQGSPYPQPPQPSLGIEFDDVPGQNTGFNGIFGWVQVYAPDRIYSGAAGNVIGVVAGAGYDTQSNSGFLYDTVPPFSTDDNPAAWPGNTGANSISIADHGTMWLIYKPATAGSIWVPVDSVNWSWAGTDLFNAGLGTWTIANTSSSLNPAGGPTNTFPIWSGPDNLFLH